MSRPCPYCGEELCLIHCVFCMTDCSVDDPEHGPACPQITGRYPLPDPRKPAGQENEPDRCIRCHQPFTDAYYLVSISDGYEPIPVYEAVCFECKVASEVSP